MGRWKDAFSFFFFHSRLGTRTRILDLNCFSFLNPEDALRGEQTAEETAGQSQLFGYQAVM